MIKVYLSQANCKLFLSMNIYVRVNQSLAETMKMHHETRRMSHHTTRKENEAR